MIPFEPSKNRYQGPNCWSQASITFLGDTRSRECQGRWAFTVQFAPKSSWAGTSQQIRETMDNDIVIDDITWQVPIFSKILCWSIRSIWTGEGFSMCDMQQLPLKNNSRNQRQRFRILVTSFCNTLLFLHFKIDWNKWNFNYHMLIFPSPRYSTYFLWITSLDEDVSFL